MGNIADELTTSIQKTGARATVSSKWNSQNVLKQLSTRFGIPGGRGELWEHLVDSVGHQDPNAWRWIAEFVRGQPCMLAMPPRLELAVFDFDDGAELVAVLELCSGFEFYVTDKALSFVLCSNHHEYLIGAGAAVDWLRARVKSHLSV